MAIAAQSLALTKMEAGLVSLTISTAAWAVTAAASAAAAVAAATATASFFSASKVGLKGAVVVLVVFVIAIFSSHRWTGTWLVLDDVFLKSHLLFSLFCKILNPEIHAPRNQYFVINIKTKASHCSW